MVVAVLLVLVVAVLVVAVFVAAGRDSCATVVSRTVPCRPPTENPHSGPCTVWPTTVIEPNMQALQEVWCTIRQPCPHLRTVQLHRHLRLLPRLHVR